MACLSFPDDSNIIIIDSRGIIPYRFGHIKNAIPLVLNMSFQIADNGDYHHLVINWQASEKVFSKLGIDDSKAVVVYGEYPNPSAARIVWTLIHYGHPNAKLLMLAGIVIGRKQDSQL